MAAQTEQDPNAEPPFELEKIPTKTILVPTLNSAFGVNAFVHHTGKLTFFI